MKTNIRQVAAFMLLAVVLFTSGFVTRGLTSQERNWVVQDYLGLAEFADWWGPYYSIDDMDYGYWRGRADGLRTAASYLEHYDTSGIRHPNGINPNPRQD